MTRVTRELRQQVVKDFAEAHGGIFDPATFLSYVRQAGETHPAYTWFEWDDSQAAHGYRLDQAREFASGLRVRFEVETVERKPLTIVTASAPMVHSPVAQRHHGGGYVVTDMKDPEHVAELCRQAGQSMRWYITRFEAALLAAGVDLASLEKVFDQLQIAGLSSLPEAA
jgi:hypothetical protein